MSAVPAVPVAGEEVDAEAEPRLALVSAAVGHMRGSWLWAVSSLELAGAGKWGSASADAASTAGGLVVVAMEEGNDGCEWGIDEDDGGEAGAGFASQEGGVGVVVFGPTPLASRFSFSVSRGAASVTVGWTLPETAGGRDGDGTGFVEAANSGSGCGWSSAGTVLGKIGEESGR